VIAAVGFASLSLAAGEPQLESSEIAPGVFARGRSLGEDRAAVEAVWIRPARQAGQPSPDLQPLLEAAFDWCSGNTPNNHFRRSERGAEIHAGCSIHVESGPYRIGRTAVLRQLREFSPVEVDLGNAAILHTPDPPRSVRVADVPSLRCDAVHQGDYYQVSDPESFDDFTHADPEGDVAIERIEPNRGKTRGCPNGDAVCKYGGHAVRVTTAKPHGLTDGGALGIGDVAVFSVPNTAYDGKRLLVKEVVNDEAFIVTPEFEPSAAAGGSVRETATTIWCNGSAWRAGKPMIAIGGPGHVHESRIALRGGRFSVDGVLFRTTAVLIDGDKGGGRGGAEWITVDTTHGGNGDLRGQIVVDMGSAEQIRDVCQHIEVRVFSDAWGPSWGPAVRNRTCRFAEIELHQGHGGGVWVGTDEPGYLGPTPVVLRGAVLGCRDGPCLWVRSGNRAVRAGLHGRGLPVRPAPRTARPLHGARRDPGWGPGQPRQRDRARRHLERGAGIRSGLLRPARRSRHLRPGGGHPQRRQRRRRIRAGHAVLQRPGHARARFRARAHAQAAMGR
jgi:hypothetical protein